ncbi:MAG TPA: hypothetical protein VJT77_06125 [Burkholderiales bacterium]|nr:hypothetical protein [Burkholderiales bacterium]
MKLFAVMLFAAVALAGCARPVVRETVVEKPIIVDRPAGAGASAASCTYASRTYTQGAISCQEKAEFRCNSGNWERTLNAC